MKSITIFLLTALIAFFLFSCTEERLMNEPGNLVPRTVDQDPALPSITVNGAMLHSEAFGHPDSTMIIIIHGGPGDDYRHLLNCKDLAQHGYRVVFYDQRGSGLSERFSKESYTNLGLGAVDLMYDDLSAVIAHYRTHPGQKVFLLGHSWGGILATGYAGKYPDAIQGLAVCEPGGLKWNDIEDYIEASLDFDIFGELLNDAAYMDQFLSGKENDHIRLDYKMGLLASENDITGDNTPEVTIKWRSGAVVNGAMMEVGEDHNPDFSAGISQFNKQVLFCYSSNNRAYTDQWAQKISAVYPGKELFKVTGTGHAGIIANRNAWTQITMPKMLEYFNSL